MKEREIDALVQEKLFNLPITWRLCTTDPDCGKWEEVEHHEPGLREGDVLWVHPVRRHPCYNWLDTDGPRENGWTAERIADTDRDNYWRIVPFYSTRIADAWPLLHKIRELQDMKRLIFFAALRTLVARRIALYYRISDLDLMLFMEPEDICKAALEAYGERMMPDWYYEVPDA